MSSPTIKIEVVDGLLKLNISDLLDVMTDEQKKTFMQNAVWKQDIFDDIVHAIISDTIVTEHFGSSIYDTRKRILDGIGTLEKNHFRSLMHDHEQTKIDRDRWQEDYWKLYHSLTSEAKARAPRTEPYQSVKWPSDAEVEKEIAERT